MQNSSKTRRSDFGTIQATERDLYILSWLGEMYAASLDHLRILAAIKSNNAEMQSNGRVGYSAVKNLYRRWSKAGWIEKQKLLAGRPQWVWLSRRGLQQSGLSYPYREPSLARLQHIHVVNAVRLFVEQKLENKARWVSERDINQVRKNDRKKHLVDGEVLYQGVKIAVEVELNRKSQKRLASILHELKRDYQAVWYFADDSCYNTVKTAVRRIPEHQNTFVLYRLSDVLKQ
ncbi:MAG: hypothetical protein KC421_15110 [Anaerolineales bacterium]|nr:hypothetical protein [Anaerolineales bacterium]